MPRAHPWHLYLARCADGSLYCGIARDVAARIAAHDAGRGARYTRGRGPLQVLLTHPCRDVGTALRLERAVKRLPRPAKLALDPPRLALLARAARRAGGARAADAEAPRRRPAEASAARARPRRG